MLEVMVLNLIINGLPSILAADGTVTKRNVFKF